MPQNFIACNRFELDPGFSTTGQGRRAWHREGRKARRRCREQDARPIARSRPQRLLESVHRLEGNHQVEIQASTGVRADQFNRKINRFQRRGCAAALSE